jgi:hypothetical protein
MAWEFPEQAWMRATVSPGLYIDATGEKIAFIGHVWGASSGKNIDKIVLSFGNNVTAGGSGCTLSLQDVAAGSGPPYQPDGTQDQTVAISNSDLATYKNGGYTTGSLSAQRSVADGDMLAVVLEFDGSGRLGSDKIIINTSNVTTVAGQPGSGGLAFYNGSSWSAASAGRYGGAILVYSDGSFGRLDECYAVFSNMGSNSFATGTEQGLEFTPDYPCTCDGFFALLTPSSASADFDLVLYEGDTALATVSFDANQFYTTGEYSARASFAAQTLTPGTTYRASVKPTTANNVALSYFDVAAAGHFDALGFFSDASYNTKSGGSWGSPTTTRRPFIGLRLCPTAPGGGGGPHSYGFVFG